MKCLATLLALCLCAIGVPSAWAQSVDTGVLGTVTDVTGSVVPGAQITVTGAATGVAQTTVSGHDGGFEIRYLVPGNYIVETNMQGFRTERREIALRVAQLARINFVLQV